MTVATLSASLASARSRRFWYLTLCGLFVLCFGLAASLDTWFQGWQGNRTKSADVLSVLLGDVTAQRSAPPFEGSS